MSEDGKPDLAGELERAESRGRRFGFLRLNFALLSIAVTVVLDSLAGSIIGPVMPALLNSLTGGAMAQMSTVFGAMMVTIGTMQLFAGPVQGALSDRYGRRPIILVSSVGLGLYFVCLALAPNLVWVFAGVVIGGAAAGSVTAAFAYVADISGPENRAARFGQLTAAMSAGGASGSLIGGFLGELDPRAPFWVAAALCALNVLFAVFVLPESLRPENRAALAWRSIHPVGAIRSIWRDYPVLKLWQAGTFLMMFGVTGVNSIFFLYVTFRFGWTSKDIGFYATFIMLTGLVVQGALVTRTLALLGERRTLLGGIVLQIVGTLVCGFATAGWMFTASIFVVMLGTVSGPVRLAVVNRVVGASDRGRLSGAERSLFSLTGIAAPAVFAPLYAAVVGAGPEALRVGTPLFICAALTVVGLAITVRSLDATPPAG